MSTKNIHREVDGLQARRDAALRWANQVRADRGMEPLDELPRGRRDSGRCPMARATGLTVGITTASDVWIGETFYLPGDVSLFVSDFDGGLHPDLIEEES